MKIAPIPTTVEDLRDHWDALDDLNRAESLKRIKKPGTSIRALAKALGHSDGTLRNLLKIADAPPADRALAKLSKISTRELLRRAKLAAKAEREKTKASEDERRAKEAKKWSTSICAWLQEQGLAWSHQENILEEVRRLLSLGEITGNVPHIVAPKGVSLKTIIERTRPADLPGDQALWLYFFVQWLGVWTFAAIRDRAIQDAAIAEALVRTRTWECIPHRKG